MRFLRKVRTTKRYAPMKTKIRREFGILNKAGKASPKDIHEIVKPSVPITPARKANRMSQARLWNIRSALLTLTFLALPLDNFHGKVPVKNIKLETYAEKRSSI
jgi:hypothetical protein